MKQYDIAFSIGRACSCTESLRKAGLQYLSFPFDWIGVAGIEPDILFRAETICNDFKGWLEREDLVCSGKDGGPGKDRYVNKLNQLVFNHDFPKGVPFSEAYPSVKEKYDRRISRFLNLLKTAKRALIVCIDMPQQNSTPPEYCRIARQRLREKFPNAQFDIILFNREIGRSLSERIEENIDEGFTRVAFDYKDYQPGRAEHDIDLEATASILRARFSVRDYRTKKEIKMLRNKTRTAKMHAAGAENAWQYFLIRRRHDLLKFIAVFSPRVLIARSQAKRYDHVLSLGVNCEVGFRFCQKWGFVDSTPFTWSQTFDIDHVVQALNNMDKIGTEGFSWHGQSMMWRCNHTGIYFHGRMKATENQPKPSEEAMKADLAELVSRLDHLKKKLLSIIADDSSKALICRVNSKEILAGDANEKLDELQRTLESLGAKNYLLVIVVEKNVKDLLKASPNRIVRHVKEFNPPHLITNANLGDPVGWNAIFTEFAPASIKKATHKFKFEK